MNYYNLNVYNKSYLYIGAILGSAGSYLGDTKKADSLVVWGLMLSGIILMLLSFKKTKGTKADELK